MACLDTSILSERRHLIAVLTLGLLAGPPPTPG